MLIDSHAHLNFNAFKRDYDEVIKRSLAENVWIVNVGSQYETSKRAVEIAEKYKEGVYAAVGLHPIHLETGLVKIKNDPEEIEIKTKEEKSKSVRSFPSSLSRATAKGEEESLLSSPSQSESSIFDYQKYKELAQSKKVVAVGEIGLDYYWKPKTKKKLEQFKNKQKEVFLKQLDLAKELNLPVIFHCRMAHDDLIEILKQYQNSTNYTMVYSLLSGVAHCFTGDWEQAKKYLEMGLYLGFNGIIFKKIERIDLEETIKYVPLDKILIETDCPYLTPPLPAEALAKAGPPPYRNEPIYVEYIAEKIAEIKNLSYEEIVKATTENARKLFNI